MVMQLTEKQQLAIDHCLNLSKRIVAITGAAGTGKTTIIKQVHTALVEQKRRVALCAPTGKAARRISESTSLTARTCHKLLEYGKPDVNPETGEAKHETWAARTKSNPLEYDDVICDEYAMVNEDLHRSLIDALPPGGRLLVFGDVAQLPPIGDANSSYEDSPFERLLKLPNSVTLDKVFRQGEESGILFNANRVRVGMSVSRRPDFRLEISDSPIAVLRRHLSDGMVDYMDLSNQVISPAKVGKLGTHALNGIIQSFYDSRLEGESLELTRNKWDEKHPVTIRVGDKVIVNENTYDLRDFFHRFSRMRDNGDPDWRYFVPPSDNQQMLNGEIGIVAEIGEDHVSIGFPDRVVDVPFIYREWNLHSNTVYEIEPLKRIDLAYAVTTHKMQGSECEHICYITHLVNHRNVDRNNVYTALTRARKSVLYIADVFTWKNGPKLLNKDKNKIFKKRDEERKRKHG